MKEFMIFMSEEEMKETLSRLLDYFPNALFVPLSKIGDIPYQVVIDLGIAVDEPLFFHWALSTGCLQNCYYLVLKMLEEPQPKWIRELIKKF